MQERVDWHLNATRLFSLVDSRSWPNTRDPLANVELPSRGNGWCECFQVRLTAFPTPCLLVFA